MFDYEDKHDGETPDISGDFETMSGPELRAHAAQVRREVFAAEAGAIELAKQLQSEGIVATDEIAEAIAKRRLNTPAAEYLSHFCAILSNEPFMTGTVVELLTTEVNKPRPRRSGGSSCFPSLSGFA